MLHCGLKLFAAVAAIGLASTGPGAAQPTGFLDDTFFGDGFEEGTTAAWPDGP